MNKHKPDTLLNRLEGILTEAYDENGNPIRVNPGVKFKMPGVQPDGKIDMANNQEQWNDLSKKSQLGYTKSTPISRQYAELKNERGNRYPSFSFDIERNMEQLFETIKEIFPEIKGFKNTEQQKNFITTMELWIDFENQQADDYYNDDSEL